MLSRRDAGSSSGDTLFTTADRWVVTDDDAPVGGDPAVTHVLFGPGAVAVTPAPMTAEQYGPVSIVAIWEEAYQEPLYLVTNMVDLDMAVQLYKKRAHIETFFSDQKSRGFQIHKSHLGDPRRLCRLLIASCRGTTVTPPAPLVKPFLVASAYAALKAPA